MPTDYQRIIDGYAKLGQQADNNASGTPTIPQEVARASFNKITNLAIDGYRKMGEVADKGSLGPAAGPIDGNRIAQMLLTGSGVESATPVERDFIQMDPDGFRQKYGNQIGAEYSAALAAGQTEHNTAIQARRSGAQIAGDTVNTVLSSPVQLLGGVMGMIAGGAGYAAHQVGWNKTGTAFDKTGVQVSTALGDFTRATQGLQSDELNASRKVFQTEQDLREQDLALEAKANEAKYGYVAAKTAQTIQGFVSSFTSLKGNTAMIGDTIANAGGSLGGSAILTSGLRAIGSGILKQGVSRGLVSVDSTLAAKAFDAAGKLEMPIAVTGMEAGGAYQQTAEAAYTKLANRTDLTENQKYEMANKTALEATAIQGGVTAATMFIPGAKKIFNTEFESAPLKPHNWKHALGEIGAETLEEGFQEGSAQLAQNKAIKDQIDPNQDIADQVGQNIALGAIGGLGSSVAGQAPGVALKSTEHVLGLPVKLAAGAFSALADRFTGKGGPAVTQTLSEAPVASQEASQTTSQEENITPHGFEVITHADEARIADIHPDTKVNTVEGSVHDMTPEQVDAFKQEGTDIVAGTKENGQPEYAVINPKAMAPTTEADHPSTMAAAEDLPDMTAKDVASTLKASEETPDQVDPIQADKLLFHADEGKVNLTPVQRMSLRSASALSRAAQQTIKDAEQLGMVDADKVSRDVLSKTGNDVGELGKNSLIQHVADIRSAYASGDSEGAANALAELRFFAEHMGNKVAALNTALVGGNTSSNNPVQYRSHIGGGRFVLSGKFTFDEKGKRLRHNTGMHVSPTSARSVALAQRVALEANAVGHVVNNLIDAFPDLGGSHIEVPALDTSLHGPASEVAQMHKDMREGVTKPDVISNDASSEQVVLQPEPQAVEPIEKAPEETNLPSVEDVKAEVAPVVEDNSGSVSDAPTDAQSTGTGSSTVTEPGAEVSADVVAKVTRPIERVYPTLVGTGTENNRLQTAFEMPTEALTRTVGDEAPLQTVRTALESATAFETFIGGDLNRNFSSAVAGAYAHYLSFADVLLSRLNVRLAAFVRHKIGNQYDASSSSGWVNGQAFNIVEQINLKYRYHPELIQNAVMASLQWYLKLSKANGNLDEADVRQILQLNFDAPVSADLVDEINNAGVGLSEMVRSLSQEIGKFWGLNQNKDVPRNHYEGVLEGVAKEILSAMLEPIEDEGKTFALLDRTEINTSEISKKVEQLNRFRPGNLSFDNETLRQFPNAIETAVVVKPDEINFIGSPPENVSKTQLRNPSVKLTKAQIKALDVQQQVPHMLNEPFIDMLHRMGENMMLRLFAGGDLENGVFNEQHKKSLEGRNLTFSSAYKSIRNLYAEVSNYAGLMGQNVSDVPVHFAYDTTVVNRQQMAGKNNPQSNKLMREAVLPTWKTIDLTNPQSMERFRMGLAQALGIKVHTMPRIDVMTALDTKLAGFSKSLSLLGSESFSSADIDTMKAEGVDSPVALHALMEYARSQQSTTDKSQFKTATYFEADGVTNGVVNAMSLFTAGPFSAQWLGNIARGGFWVGGAKTTLDQLRAKFSAGSEDLYALAGSNTTARINKLRAQYAGNGKVMAQFNAVQNLLTEFLPKAVALDSDGRIKLDRGAVKNPLTITIYGSGAKGIAGNITDELTGKIYEAMTKAAQRKAENPKLTDAEAFYGEDASTAQPKYNQMISNLVTLSTGILATSDRRLYVESVKQELGPNAEFEKFVFDPGAYKNIRTNVLHAFINPMVEGITETVGKDLINTLQTIKTQVQVWSLIGKFAYRQAYAQALEAKRAADPTMKKNDLLSPTEEKAVLQSVEGMLPKFGTGDQNFLFGTSQKADLRTEFARAYGKIFPGVNADTDPRNNDMRTDAYGYTPDDAGVSGIPNMTIASGDGQAILNLLNDPEFLNNPELIKHFLQIFDGIHSSTEDMDQMGALANRAVFNSWQRNPLEHLNRAYADFLTKLDLSKLDLTRDDKALLTKSLFRDWYRYPVRPVETIQAAMVALGSWSEEMSDAISERQAVLAQVQSSTDQMAGAGVPHVNEGILLTGSLEQKAAQLEALRVAKTNTTSNQAEELPAPKEQAVASPETQKETPKEAVKETPKFSFTAASSQLFGNMLDRAVAKITPDALTRALIRDVLRSGAASDFMVHVGSREALIAKAAEMGIVVPSERAGFKGFMDPQTKSVFVVDGAPETMLHELIHAATYGKLQAFFSGADLSPETKDAVSKLQGLMEQFKELNLEGEAYQNTLDEMERQAVAGNQAGELNEFMAWALANADLQSQLKETKVNPALKMARSVVQGLKRLLWGGKRSAAVKDDFFSNLRFNTNVVMRADPTVADAAREGVLYHDETFGKDDRLAELSESISRKITDQFRQEDISQDVQKSRLNKAKIRAATLANAFIKAGFTMTMQERGAFMQMVAIMSLNSKLDANATERAHVLYSHVLQSLSVEDFMRTPEENDPNDIEQASEKLHALEGKFKNLVDAQGRSALLPSFMALAATNQEFRQILQKLSLPKTEKLKNNSVDNILDNLGTDAVDTVSRFVAGEGIRTKDTQEALDNLMDQMMETSEDGQMFIEKFTNPVGNGIDRLNQVIVDGVTWLGDKAAEGVQKLETAKPDAKIAIEVAKTLQTALDLLNDAKGKQAATNLMSRLNSSNLYEPFYNLLKDLVGRTAENGEVYDLIKTARTWVNGVRQQFREHLPTILNSKFEGKLTDKQQSQLHQGLGQTGLASLLEKNNTEHALKMLSETNLRDVESHRLRGMISDLSPKNASLIDQKAKELANYMINKTVVPGLLANAEAITHLLGTGVLADNTSPEMVSAVDQLVTLYAVDALPESTKTDLASLVRGEAKGMSFMLDYLHGQDLLDKEKATGNARFNHWKGHMPALNSAGISLIIANDEEAEVLKDMGYEKLGNYAGSSKDPTGKNRAYYFLPMSGKAPFAQGIMQNIQQTTFGVDRASGYSNALTAGVISDPALVKKISENTILEQRNPLIPRFNDKGVLYAYERSVDQNVIGDRLGSDTNMSKMMGVRSGRQSEEANANQINKALVDALRDMWDRDSRKGRQSEYVNLSTDGDAIHKDAMRIFSKETAAYIDARFPDGFKVRRDMIDDAIGYRHASIGDVFTGNSRWSPAVQEHVKNILMKMFGTKAYRYAVTAEKLFSNTIQDVKVILVVKSIIVPMANAASNIFQLIGRGVPLVHILKAMPKKVIEIEAWHKSRFREIEAEAELHATHDILGRRRLEAEIQSIRDSHKRLSIWPLIEAGEFSTISDAGSREDIALSEGRLSDYIEQAANRMPAALKTAARYAILAKSTPLYRALEKSVAYGDFVAKAVQYDDLVGRKGMTQSEAIHQITEEYVNYDRLAGRDREYLEKMGLIWFYNFKIRSAKVAVSMIRNNPVHSLIAASLPTPVHGTGLPITDNLWSKFFNGRLGWSTGFGMAFRAPGMLPLGNLLF